MNGLIIIDKPYGLTSHQVVQEIRRLAPRVKVGHAGTLDPAATGVLPVCLGKATRFVEYLMDLPKGYRAEVELGVTTETGDGEGEIVQRRPVPPMTPEMVKEVLKTLAGSRQQVPPQYSALKYRGKPMYYWARQGIEVELKPRTVHIYRLDLIQFLYPQRPHLVLEADCSRGTYIRSLAEEIGERLGTGAYVSALRRLFVGPFGVDEAIDIGEVQPSKIIPADKALTHLPALTLPSHNIARLRQGGTVPLTHCAGEKRAGEMDGGSSGEFRGGTGWKAGQLIRVYETGGLFKTLAVLIDNNHDQGLQLKPKINY